MLFLLIFSFVGASRAVPTPAPKDDKCHPRTIIVPLLQEPCASSTCTVVMDTLTTSCSFNSLSRRPVVLNPAFNKPLECEEAYTCPLADSYDLVMTPHLNFLLELQLKNYIHENVWQCVDQTSLVFFFNIPCADFELYPDVARLFSDENLGYTIRYVEEVLRVHTVLYFIPVNYNADIQNTPCDRMAEFFHENVTEYFHFYNLTATEAEDAENNFVCNITIPQPEVKKRGLTPQIIAVISISCLFAVFLIGLIIWFAFRVKRRYKESQIEWFAEQHQLNARRLLFGRDRKMDEWELIPRDMKVELDTILGKGICATVYLGHLKKVRGEEVIEAEVAVKSSHSYATRARKDMMREIEFMKTIPKHPNLVNMLGCVSEEDRPVIVTELCENGSLHDVLTAHTLHYTSADPCDEVPVCLLLRDLLNIAMDVCEGMLHLASLGYVHRDLAARNVFLTANGIAKVGDFGFEVENEDLADFLEDEPKPPFPPECPPEM
ncbi:hypothetical protein M3Y99_00657900 [Aphelenchoides fujianensis]|nr:hypothetical protein M3Y99_00657900 [Aphelenchoides fujianensis]